MRHVSHGCCGLYIKKNWTDPKRQMHCIEQNEVALSDRIGGEELHTRSTERLVAGPISCVVNLDDKIARRVHEGEL